MPAPCPHQRKEPAGFPAGRARTIFGGVKDPLDCIFCELEDDCEALEPAPRWFALIFWAFIAALLAMVFYAYAKPAAAGWDFSRIVGLAAYHLGSRNVSGKPGRINDFSSYRRKKPPAGQPGV
jgi:hypothetical protein